MSRLLTPEEAAERLRVSVRSVYTYLRSGELPGRKVGGLWRIDEHVLYEANNQLTADSSIDQIDVPQRLGFNG